MLTKDETIGGYLRQLIQRSGMTQTQVAKAMGYKGASSIQRFLDAEYGRGDVMKLELASKFAKAFVGKGDPPITNDEVFWLSGVELTERGTFRAVDFGGAVELGYREYPAEIAESDGLSVNSPNMFKLPLNLPAYSTNMEWHAGVSSLGGEDIILEETKVNTSEVIRYFRRPPPLSESDKAYVHYIQGSTMEPRFEEGEVILIDPRRPIRARDYVMVMLSRDDADGGQPEKFSGVVRRLVRRTSDYVELEQFNPRAVFRIPMESVIEIAPVIPWSDVLDF